MLTRITTDAHDQTWMQLRVCPQCTPHDHNAPARPFGLDATCPSCRGPGEVIWRHAPQYRTVAAPRGAHEFSG